MCRRPARKPVQTPMWDKALAQVDEGERSLPAEALDRYRRLLAAYRKFIHQPAAGIPADDVASAIESALTGGQGREGPWEGELVGAQAALPGRRAVGTGTLADSPR